MSCFDLYFKKSPSIDLNEFSLERVKEKVEFIGLKPCQAGSKGCMERGASPNLGLFYSMKLEVPWLEIHLQWKTTLNR